MKKVSLSNNCQTKIVIPPEYDSFIISIQMENGISHSVDVQMPKGAHPLSERIEELEKKIQMIVDYYNIDTIEKVYP